VLSIKKEGMVRDKQRIIRMPNSKRKPSSVGDGCETYARHRVGEGSQHDDILEKMQAIAESIPGVLKGRGGVEVCGLQYYTTPPVRPGRKESGLDDTRKNERCTKKEKKK